MFELLNIKFRISWLCVAPQTMQSMTQYEDIVKEILFYFSEK
jgi:dihydropteroate synthase